MPLNKMNAMISEKIKKYYLNGSEESEQFNINIFPNNIQGKL